MDRRRFIAGAVSVGALSAVPWAFPNESGASALQWQPTIRPRSDWDQGHGATGSLDAEDPRFLLVHHTASPGNDYTADEVPALIRSMYWYHTSDEKNWPDVAYNFFVDQFGTIWEGRTGSIAGPVRGSATGGNQGYSQLCCFIGNLDQQDPTAAATQAMVDLLSWLALQREIDVSEGATVTFDSLGSNRWPSGTSITTPTIAGHRDMSQTGCPGDRGYAFVTGALPELVRDKIRSVAPSATGTSSAQTTTTTAASSTTDSSTSSTEPDPRLSSSTSTNSSTTSQSSASSIQPQSPSTSRGPTNDAELAGAVDDNSDSTNWTPVFAGVAVVAAAAQATAIRRRSGSSSDADSTSGAP